MWSCDGRVSVWSCDGRVSVWSCGGRVSVQNDVETVDPRGRTPLHLAVSLGHLESVRVLLRHGAQVTTENAHHWTGTLGDRSVTGRYAG